MRTNGKTAGKAMASSFEPDASLNRWSSWSKALAFRGWCAFLHSLADRTRDADVERDKRGVALTVHSPGRSSLRLLTYRADQCAGRGRRRRSGRGEASEAMSRCAAIGERALQAMSAGIAAATREAEAGL